MRDYAQTDSDRLARLMTNPGAIAEASAEEIPALLAHLAAVQAALSARLLRLQAVVRQNPEANGNDLDPLLDMKEAAALLGMNLSFTYELARQNRLPVVRLGRYVRIRRSALQHWLREREAGEAERRR